MSCVPGMPCFEIRHPKKCGECNIDPIPTDVIYYSGPNLPCSGINSCDSLTTILQKIDPFLCASAICEVVRGCTTSTSTTSTTTTTPPSTTTTTTTLICNCYTFTNNNITTEILQYKDCSGNSHFQDVLAGNSLSICVNPPFTWGDSTTFNGPCDVSPQCSTTTTTTNPPTTTTTTT